MNYCISFPVFVEIARNRIFLSLTLITDTYSLSALQRCHSTTSDSLDTDGTKCSGWSIYVTWATGFPYFSMDSSFIVRILCMEFWILLNSSSQSQQKFMLRMKSVIKLWNQFHSELRIKYKGVNHFPMCSLVCWLETVLQIIFGRICKWVRNNTFAKKVHYWSEESFLQATLRHFRKVR